MEWEFGLERVEEPRGELPPLAWKLNNNRDLRKGEARVRLELISLEWDSFQQISSSSGYGEDKIRARILDIVEKRGKLQNPFTHSGGVFLGTVEELSPEFRQRHQVSEGEQIYCGTSLASLPVFLEEITEVDFNYGMIRCSGYAILFENTKVYPANHQSVLSDKARLGAFVDARRVYGAWASARDNHCKKVAILAKDLQTMLLYGATLGDTVAKGGKVIGFLEIPYYGSITREEARGVLSNFLSNTYFVDLREPVETWNTLRAQEGLESDFDMVIATDGYQGVETLAAEMIQENGMLYFSSFGRNSLKATLCGEAMGKNVLSGGLDRRMEGFFDFFRRFLDTLAPSLEKVDRLYTRSSFRISEAGSEAFGEDDDQLKEETKGFIYQDQATRSLLEEVVNIARYDCNMIIEGETGVGKEKVLDVLYQNSQRSSRPCVKINCATIQENLAESEFFGYESGSFTGAQTGGKAGYFETANQGILFLDEIGALSMNMQTKLLRVLQDNGFYRVGGTKQINVDVRVICANNVPLRQLVEEGAFREDLYYRLNICTIEVPPLRERRADIPVLAEAFIRACNQRYGTVKEISPEALEMLYHYEWPGNVRELENMVHRLVISTRGNVIDEVAVDSLLNEGTYGDLLRSIRQQSQKGDRLDFHEVMEQQEKRLIEYALKREGTTRKAADYLGLPQTTLARKKLKHGL